MKQLMPGRKYIVAIPYVDTPEERLEGLANLLAADGAEVIVVPMHGLTVVEVIERVKPHDPTEWKVSRAVAQDLLRRGDITVRDGLDNVLRFAGETDG